MDKKRVVAAIIVKDGFILAAQRKSGTMAGGWEFPGGKIEPGESPEEALVREIREELNVSINHIQFFANIMYEYPDFLLDMDCFTCQIEAGEPQLHDHSAFQWLNANTITNVDWLPADIDLIPKIQDFLR